MNEEVGVSAVSLVKYLKFVRAYGRCERYSLTRLVEPR